jgi:hypothetical protein
MTENAKLIERWQSLSASSVPDAIAPFTRPAFWILVCDTVIYFLRQQRRQK